MVRAGTATSSSPVAPESGWRSVIAPAGVDGVEPALLRFAQHLASRTDSELSMVRPDPVGTVDAIVRAAAQSTEPVVCLSARRRSTLGRARVDRVTTELVQRLSCPVIIAGPHCRPGAALEGTDLFICIDSSDRSQAILPLAKRWARSLGLHPWLVTVISPADLARLAGANALDVDILQGGVLARSARDMGYDQMGADWEVLHGSCAATALITHTACSQAALLALNTHGASAPVSAAMGRVAARLVLESRVPLLLTRSVLAPVRPSPAPRQERPNARAGVAGSRSRPSTTGSGLRPCTLQPLRRQPALRSSAPQLSRPQALPPNQPPHSASPRTRLAVAVAGLALGALVTTHVALPYYTVGGTTLRTSTLVRVPGTPRRGAHGEILLPIVTARRVTVARAVGNWLAGTADLHPTRDVLGSDPAEARRVNLELMESAKQTARFVALRQLGLTVADGTEIQIDSRGIGGPSAGLAFALEIIAVLTSADLTGGHQVGVTGTLDSQGHVGPVGGVAEKVTATRRSGAELLIVPRSEYGEAVADAGDALRVAGVNTLTDALAVLADLRKDGR